MGKETSDQIKKNHHGKGESSKEKKGTSPKSVDEMHKGKERGRVKSARLMDGERCMAKSFG